MGEALDIAVAGDRIDGDDLQDSIDRLKALANMLDEIDTDDMTVAQVQEIGRAQSSLRALAGSLVNKQIDLLAGEARVTADHVNAAVLAAQDTIQRIADIRDKLAKVGALLEFFSAVLTGDGKVIVQAAMALKNKLG
ncbi:MAG TPA: hypothetical protein VJ743_01885 [Albitalea sp.]|nr:hypothetical protein [Albitalea sp.]